MSRLSICALLPFFALSAHCSDDGAPPPLATATAALTGACLDGSECGDGHYCRRGPGHCDSRGTCSAMPQACQGGGPVCGCDGQTWPSACDAALAGVSLASKGPCLPPACRHDDHCGTDQYCAKSTCDPKEWGLCELPPMGCGAVWDPVCGCDASTWGNACEAAAAGVNVDAAGPCDGDCFADAHCDDGDFCNGAELCVEGGCTPGWPPWCDDGNPCTTDKCDPAGGCSNAPISCDDGDPCTKDKCTSWDGCVHTPICP